MAKSPRVKIPKDTHEKVLKEFRHLCAICGTTSPQIHHIDEDASNNDPYNLLPLCPNCHLTDQHNPTSRIEPERLALFRRHKDPFILAPQFAPLFRRMRFLLPLESHFDNSKLGDFADLIRFVQALKMGAYYAKKIGDCLRSVHKDTSRITHPELGYSMVAVTLSYQDKAQAIEMLIELLAFQEWPRPDNWRKPS